MNSIFIKSIIIKSKIIIVKQDLDYELRRQSGSSYVGQRLASGLPGAEEVMVHESPKKQRSDYPHSVSQIIYYIVYLIIRRYSYIVILI